jgi:hypothetical protein
LDFSNTSQQLPTEPVSNHGCERIAPVSHQDQAIGGVVPSAPL